MERCGTFTQGIPWENWVDLVTLKALDIESILLKYLEWSVAEDEVVAWVEFLEMRDDIGYQSDMVKQILIQVANPGLYWILNKERVVECMGLLWLLPYFPL